MLIFENPYFGMIPSLAHTRYHDVELEFANFHLGSTWPCGMKLEWHEWYGELEVCSGYETVNRSLGRY